MKPSSVQNVPAEARRHRSNCAVVTVAAVANIPYEQALEVCLRHGFVEGRGMTPVEQKNALHELGFGVEEFAGLAGSTVRQVEDHFAGSGRLLIFTLGHVGAVVEGERHDTYYRARRRAQLVWSVFALNGEEPPRQPKTIAPQRALEQKLWIDFLQPRGEAAVAEMAEFLGVTEKRVRGLIDGLRRKGRPIVSVGKGRFRVEQED